MKMMTSVRARRSVAALLLGTVIVAVSVLPAAAHSTLVSSSPADGSTLGVAPTEVVLTFNENVVTVGDQVLVTSPSGLIVSQGNPEIVDSTVTEPLRTLDENGTYLINYRIVSADGHPVQRQLSFTLNVPGLKTGVPATPSPTAAPSTSSGGPNLIVIIVGAALVGLVIGLAAALLGRRKGSSSTNDDDGPTGAGSHDDLVD
jgi:copper resistance protein C